MIEFWATWCGPCRQIFPHLTDVQRKYKSKGLVVVGLTNEQNKGMLKQFVDQQSYAMDYRVAMDADGEGQEKLIMPAGARGIPHSFVVDCKGTIQYSGHPGDPKFEAAVEKACKEYEEAAPKKEVRTPSRVLGPAFPGL